MEQLMQSELFAWVILPIAIFLARILDVSIGTLRLIFISKGFKYLAPLLGFFEVIIWLLAIGQIMQNLDNWVCYVAYGLGFATGNYFGIYLDEKMSIGTLLIRVIPKVDSAELIHSLREKQFGVSAIDVEGMSGKVKMLLSIVKRKDIKEYIRLVILHNPNAFYTVEDVKTVKEGYFKTGKRSDIFGHMQMFRRPGK